MSRPHEVTAADMQSKVYLVSMVADAVIVALNVCIESFLGGFAVGLIFFPACEHFLGTEVCEVGVVELYVANAGGVENVQLGADGLSDV